MMTHDDFNPKVEWFHAKGGMNLYYLHATMEWIHNTLNIQDLEKCKLSNLDRCYQNNFFIWLPHKYEFWEVSHTLNIDGMNSVSRWNKFIPGGMNSF